MTLNFDACYRAILRPLLFRLDAELAHRLTLAMLSRVPRRPPSADPPALRIELFGHEFSNPLGLAAGLDKDARAMPAWNALGFGFAEIGTVTPKPQPGNPRPRIWRIPQHQAMVNRLGFPSDGMEKVAARIERLNRRALRLRLAINLGPNKETPAARVAEDYTQLMRQFGMLADFIVVNLSSPNTPGLRNFQAPERMRSVVEAIRTAAAGLAQRPPILIKLAPDLEPPMLADICAAALELQLDGIVATNTTLQRDTIGVGSTLPGGLSGEPLKQLARATVARIYRQLLRHIPIVGVGGVATADDAYGHIRAGASLVELYTAIVYRGPGVVHEIKSGLLYLLARDGFRSISEAVGTEPQE
jgi:dihydroorotate dehydrogenase